MVTPGGSYPIVDGEHKLAAATTYYGLSTDTKPLDVANGSAFIEMDTSKLYFFDAENPIWYQWGGS